MSREQKHVVNVPADEMERVKSLQRSAAAAAARLAQAPLGDTTDGIRHQHIQSEIDKIAFTSLAAKMSGVDVPSSGLELQISWPFMAGPTVDVEPVGDLVPTRDAWRPTAQATDRRSAVMERFQEQLRRWADSADEDVPREPVCPSDISNSVLSEGLRSFVEVAPNSRQGTARIVYRDGSEARPMPIRCLHFKESTSVEHRQILKVSLLSVRHMEMDATVDGAWLRNREISLPRPSGQTDELVYQYSRQQFVELARDNPVEIHLFQTGLEPAIVGFYRALADHHLYARGKPVSVFPQYYAGESNFDPGTPWVTGV